MKKSLLDTRLYRFIELENNLKCVLISDGSVDKAAASLSVGVGNYSDPDYVPGIAHFLEHMIFLGTEKYPTEGFFDKFLQKCGGSTNAYTSDITTNFVFDVNHDHLFEALDKFASFFICPLFTEDATDREMRAVDSEHQKNLQSDSQRIMQIEKHFSDHKHPFHKFGTGTLETLCNAPKKNGINVRKELFKFYHSYYSANIMCLAVLGKEDLDVLEDSVRKYFSLIKNLDIKRPSFPGTPFSADFLKKRLSIIPIKDLQLLKLNWMFPPDLKYYREKPNSYAAHLLGHEAPGSILSFLKQKQWANSLSARIEMSDDNFSVFSLSINLTDDGLKHINDIITVVFQYIEKMKSITSEEQLLHFKELRDIAEMNFRFKSKEDPSNYVISLAERVFKYDVEDILSGPFLYYKFDEHLVKHFIDNFGINNFRYNVVSNSFSGKMDKIEPVYGTEYTIEDIPEDFIKIWSNTSISNELKLPTENLFIATNFEIFEPSSGDSDSKEIDSPPIKIMSDEIIECQQKLDLQFRKPKVHAMFNIITPEAYYSPRNAVLTQMYCKYVEFSIIEYAYDADIAGLTYKLYVTATGLQLSFVGYNQRMYILFERIIDRMKSVQIDPERFEIFKELMNREYTSFDSKKPYCRALYNQNICYNHKHWHNDQYKTVLAELKVDDLRLHIRSLFRQSYTQCFFNGNLRRQDAIMFCNKIKSTLAIRELYPSQYSDLRIIKLKDDHSYLYSMHGTNPDEPNSAIVVSFQIGKLTIENRSILRLIDHITQQWIYEQLRTIEQLGYLVFSHASVTRLILSFEVIVQSLKQPNFVENRIEACLEQMKGKLANLSVDDFEANKRAVIKLVLEKDQSLYQTTRKLQPEIINNTYIFDRVYIEAEALEKISLEQINNFYNKFISCGAPHRRKMANSIVSLKTCTSNNDENTIKFDDNINKKQNTSESSVKQSKLPIPPEDSSQKVKISDFYTFKRCMPLYPNFGLLNKN